MKLLERVSKSQLWDIGYLLTDMMKDIHMYFAGELKIPVGEPYNHINDGIEGQMDFMKRYLRLKKILDPFFEKDLIIEKTKKIEKLTFLMNDIKNLIEDKEVMTDG